MVESQCSLHTLEKVRRTLEEHAQLGRIDVQDFEHERVEAHVAVHVADKTLARLDIRLIGGPMLCQTLNDLAVTRTRPSAVLLPPTPPYLELMAPVV